MNRLRVVALGLVVTGCLDVTLPDEPGPGTLSGTVLRAVPGWTRPLPAEGAKLEVLGMAIRAEADLDGRFVLDGFLRPASQLLVRLDTNADGGNEAQRLIALGPLKVGAGKHISLGEIVLGKDARVRGTVRSRGTQFEQTGHSGTTVVVKGTNFITFSADDGSFEFDSLPEGTFDLVLFREGFIAVVVPLVLSSGEERVLDLVLFESTNDARPAEVTGKVISAAGALTNARVQFVGMNSRAETRTDVEGSWSTPPLLPGVYNFGFEADGHLPVLLEGILLVPGPQQLDDVVLLRGMGMALVVNAPPSLRSDGGTDCGGACSTGFLCSARETCTTPACELISCPGACQGGQCFATTCGSNTCAPGELCDVDRCVPIACAGKSCPSMSTCAAGRCVTTLCSLGPCPSGQVCDRGQCIDTRCVDVECGTGLACAAGHCLPTSGGAVVCAPGAVFISGRCVDLRCEGVQCTPGSFCQAGLCTGSGVYVAGTIYPDGRTSNVPQTLIIASTPQGWKRVNFTALPRVIQMVMSKDGQWLIAHTDDFAGNWQEGSIWRSSDGVTWLPSWLGDQNTVGIINGIAIDHVSGRVYASLHGGNLGSAGGVIVSEDDGATWQRAWFMPLINGAIRERPSGVAPELALVSQTNFGQSGVFPIDGGPRFPFFSPADALLLSDPTGRGLTYIASDQLTDLDSGVLGPMRVACQGCVTYSDAPSRGVHVAASNSVWFAPDGLGPWALRATPIITAASFHGLARASDGVLYLANEGNSGPSLLASTDEGVTWGSASEDWRSDLSLSDPIAAWQPDANYGFQSRVRPSVPNGLAYECSPGNCVSGGVEPTWRTDGGVTPDQFGTWNAFTVNAARLSAIVSRACSVGQQRCGAACVSVVSDRQNCGACGVTCPNACVFGRCVGLVDAGTSTGCADGTREGFVDETRWPDVAACSGTWPAQLIDTSADAVCGAGFHVCTDGDSELATISFHDAVSFAGCFAYRASNDEFDGCGPLECTANALHDDMAGLGRSCLALSGVQHRGDGGTQSCLADGTRIDAQCCASSVTGLGCRQTSQSGVVCCRD